MLPPLSKEKSERNEQTVRHYIRDQLYPDSQYPPKNFPRIHDIAYQIFLEGVSRDPAKQSVFQTSSDLAELRSLVRSEVAFANLLGHDSGKILTIYEPMISAFVHSVHDRREDQEEVVQNIVTGIQAGKMSSIRENYDTVNRRRGSFTSYFMAVVRNVYIDRMRQERGIPQPGAALPAAQSGPDLMNRATAVEECERLDRILLLFYRLRSKLELCMKLKYRLTVTSEDVRRCFQRSDNADISILTRDFRQTKDEEMYDAVITTFNRHDSAKHVGDSLRKWVNAKVNEIISHLNTAHGRIVYTEKLLGSLLSKYYEKTTAKETVE